MKSGLGGKVGDLLLDLWPSRAGGHLAPPSATDSWLSGRSVPMPESRQLIPPGDGSRAAPYRGVAGDQRRGEPESGQRMLGHASAAMTLDVYADLFDSDLSSVAESVGKMWARDTETHIRSKLKRPLPAHMSVDDRSLLSGLNCSDGPAGDGENPI